jgi:hypothetical protein
MLAHVLVALALSAGAGPTLSVETAAPTNVTATTAVLHGSVDPGGAKTTFWFEVGTTTDYGIVTNPASSGSRDKATPVTHGVDGLAPDTTYHVRIVASHDDEVVLGGDTTFTTPAAPAQPGSEAGDPAQQPQQRSLAPAAPPQLGHSIAVAPNGGSVAVRIPGAARAVTLARTASVPVGSIVDTRRGAVKLTTSLPNGTTQTGSFHGGLFQIRQPVDARGMTELVLRGPQPTCTSAGARAAATTAKRPPRALWGHDKHGRFRTRGSNAVITVRGTTWYVADRCDGTLTRVTSGSVAVRDLHRHRTVVVHAGHRYLAKRH